MKSDNSFLKGTLILTVSSIVVKVIGALNWILLSRVLGGEGIGLYQMGFPIYLMAITVSSAGIPVAISIVTAEKVAQNDFKGAERVFHVTLRLLFITGLVFSLALFFGAQKLIDWQFIRDARAYYSIIALAPAVFFVTSAPATRKMRRRPPPYWRPLPPQPGPGAGNRMQKTAWLRPAPAVP